MIIACPNCTARYDIDDSRFLPGGRSVRCSECSTSWFVPAPQNVETLMPSARVDGNTQTHSPNSGPSVSGPGYTGHNTTGLRNPTPSNPDSPAAVQSDSDSLFAPRTGPSDEPRVFRRRKIDQSPEVDAEDLPRPQWGPMAERRAHDNTSQAGHVRREDEQSEGTASMWKVPRRRATDTVVDTDWQEVSNNAAHHKNDHKNHEAETRKRPHQKGASVSSNATIISPVAADDPTAPSEVFAAVNVQPRELERALKRVRRKAEARDKNRLTPMRVMGWASLLAVICTLVYSGYHYRDDIVRIAPASAKVYASVGIDASPYGLSIKNINHRVALATTGPIVEIFGELHNQSEKSITPPLLQAEALNVHGKLLASWTFNPDDLLVRGNGKVSFSTRAPAPEGIAEVVLSFAPEKSRGRSE